jgi:hypothetical protein
MTDNHGATVFGLRIATRVLVGSLTTTRSLKINLLGSIKQSSKRVFSIRSYTVPCVARLSLKPGAKILKHICGDSALKHNRSEALWDHRLTKAYHAILATIEPQID